MSFWRGRRVFLTGHTGFKGSWLTQWLTLEGAGVTGYSLPDDVRDGRSLRDALHASRADVVIHMAAQTLVRASYDDPVLTYGTNVMGTVNLLEAVRGANPVRVVVVVTSDKCYAHGAEPHAFREDDPLGGRDPYSSSKACAELVAAAWRDSFFSDAGSPRVISARAGNVIGPGDWAEHRLVPDLVRAFSRGESATVRNPDATRPWQFVLDPLFGYLRLAEAAFDSRDLPGAWNFGPARNESRSVRWLADALTARWGGDAKWSVAPDRRRAEAPVLQLDSTRARSLLGWTPRVELDEAVAWTIDGYKALLRGEPASGVMSAQIRRFAERA
jgi:CDP-glucose 4,6-dehydratase